MNKHRKGNLKITQNHAHWSNEVSWHFVCQVGGVEFGEQLVWQSVRTDAQEAALSESNRCPPLLGTCSQTPSPAWGCRQEKREGSVWGRRRQQQKKSGEFKTCTGTCSSLWTSKSVWQLSWGGHLMGSRVVKPGPSVAGWDSGLWLGHCLFPRPFLWRSSTLCFLATLNWAAFLCHVSLLSRFGANRYWDLWDCRPS